METVERQDVPYLSEPFQDQENNQVQAQTVPLQPLKVSGLVVQKADLIRTLQAFVPGLCDIQVTEDGEHFWLVLSDQTGQEEQEY